MLTRNISVAVPFSLSFLFRTTSLTSTHYFSVFFLILVFPSLSSVIHVCHLSSFLDVLFKYSTVLIRNMVNHRNNKSGPGSWVVLSDFSPILSHYFFLPIFHPQCLVGRKSVCAYHTTYTYYMSDASLKRFTRSQRSTRRKEVDRWILLSPLSIPISSLVFHTLVQTMEPCKRNHLFMLLTLFQGYLHCDKDIWRYRYFCSCNDMRSA